MGAIWIYRIRPEAVLLYPRADDECLCLRIVGKVLGGDSRAHYGRYVDCPANGIHFVGFRRLAGGDAGYYHTVNQKKLSGLRCLSDVDICSDRVRGVFLLHISKDADMLGANRTSIAQQ